MREREGTRSEASKTLINSASGIEEEEEGALRHQNQNEDSEGDGFFACYLLASLNPRYKGHTYIGFTVNPRRRIRQHNGEIGCGAWRTKKRRPWEMVFCIYGFPTNVSALQFEWAWQHPVKSLAVRKAAAGFKSLSGIANKIKLAYTMLTLPSWQSMNITVNFFSTKYMKHCAGCPNLPEHMKIEIGSMDELPCYTERINGLSENEDDSIDEVEFNNNTSNSDSVPDACDYSITLDSPKNTYHGDKISESFGWNQESEARESPGHSFASQDQSQPFGSITSLMVKSSPETSLKRVEIIEDTDFMSVMNKSSAVLSQPECEQSGAISAANKNREVSNTFIVLHKDEIIDLSTASPSCRSVLDSKKRRVSTCVGSKEEKKKESEKEPEMSKNAQFRAIQPSPSILSFVEKNLLGRRRLIDLRRAGYNIDLSTPLDNIPFSNSSERERIEENVFRNKLEFFAAAKVSSLFPPPNLLEIAFAGRSNVGKSSLLKALTRQWGVVRTSDKPGLTQTINFFKLGTKLGLVDLPGYGFAYAKEEVKEAWEELVKEYVSTRVGLKRVCLLIDTKWGMNPRDHELIELMERSKTKYQIVLTKTDVVFPIDVARRAMQIEESLLGNKSIVQPLMMVSSKSGAGIRSLRTVLANVARFAKI